MAENKNSAKVEDMPNVEENEIAAAIEENKKSINEKAKEKLKAELAKATDKSFADPIIGYLLERCGEDKGLAEDVCQNHKTWKGCLDYIYSQAKKVAKNSRQCAVRNDVVFEWAEDYYHADDKAEVKAKAQKEAGSKAREEVDKKEQKTRVDYDTARKSPMDNHKLSEEEIAAMDKKETPKLQPQPKKNNKDMDGQMDLFSLMGM